MFLNGNVFFDLLPYSGAILIYLCFFFQIANPELSTFRIANPKQQKQRTHRLPNSASGEFILNFG